MGVVNTVTGSVDATDLGPTLMHEHFLYGFAGWQGDSTIGKFNKEETMKLCMEACRDAGTYGIRTIVDATTNECGRNVRFLRELSERTGTNIICSTGYYFQQESAYAYWQFRKGFADIEKEIYEMMAEELTKGIDGTDIKAGVIKLASSYNEIAPMEEIFFKAAARAQKETGCVIITHTQQGTMGPEQAQLLIAEGADPSRIVIGHMCGNTSLEYQRKVLEQGVFVNMDRFGLQGELFHTPTDEERMDLIVNLVREGYGNRILLSHDYVNVNLGRELIMTPFMKETMRDANIRNIGKKVLPGLKARGLSKEQIQTFLETNPKMLFC